MTLRPPPPAGTRADSAAGTPPPAAAEPAIRARRVPRGVAALWLWQSTLALLVSGPAASAVAGALGGDPQGDRQLFQPGGHVLLSVLSREAIAVRATLTAACATLVVATIAGLVPTAAVMEAMCHPARGARSVDVGRSLSGAVRAFPALAVLLLGFGAAEGSAVASAWLVGTLIEGWTHAPLGEARAELLGVGAAALFAPVVVAIAIAHDLARAAVVRHRVDVVRALTLASRNLRRAPAPLAWAYGWRTAVSAGLVTAAAMPVHVLSAGTAAGTTLVIAIVHQTVVVARVALRASWLAAALRGVSPS